MKLPIYKGLLSALLGIFLIITAQSVLAASINWRPYTNQVFTDAKEKNKLILVYVKSDTCHWCARVNSEVLNKSSIVSAISKRFIPVMVDIQSDASIAEQYNVYGTPTFIILDGDRREVSRLEGFEPASKFKSYLDRF